MPFGNLKYAFIDYNQRKLLISPLPSFGYVGDKTLCNPQG